jgi:hypothetical protein
MLHGAVSHSLRRSEPIRDSLNSNRRCKLNYSTMTLNFLRLNIGWNAEPNAPEPHVEVRGSDIILGFHMNAFQFPEFAEGENGYLRFANCVRYRLGPSNDEGWYRGQGRFSKIAPEWGDFYEVSGDPASSQGPTDWHVVSAEARGKAHHFLFYFRDETFECLAEQCFVEPKEDNALLRAAITLPSS